MFLVNKYLLRVYFVFGGEGNIMVIIFLFVNRVFWFGVGKIRLLYIICTNELILEKIFRYYINWIRIVKIKNSESKLELLDIKEYFKGKIIKIKWYCCKSR